MFNAKKGRKRSFIKQKSYENPYFNNQHKKKGKSFVAKLSLKTKLLFVAFLSFFVLLIWFLIYSKYFLIYDLNIQLEKINGIGGVGEEDVEQIAREQLRNKLVFFPGNNIFLFDTNKLYDKLSSDLAFEEIEVVKNYPNSLDIYLKEVSYALTWLENGVYSYITPAGEVITEVGEEGVKDIFPLVKNQGRYLVENGKINNREKHLEFAIKLYKDLNDTNIVNIEYFILGNKNDNTLTMKILEGPEVYFDINNDFLDQKEKFISLKDKKLKDDMYSKTYLDLRYGDYIYMK